MSLLTAVATALSDATEALAFALADLSDRIRPASSFSRPPPTSAGGGGFLERLQNKWLELDPDTRKMLLGFSLSMISGGILMWQARKFMEESLQKLDSPDEGADRRAASVPDKRLIEIATRLHRKGHSFDALNSHELRLLGDVILPSDVGTRFTDIGGQDRAVHDLQSYVVAPLRFPELYRHSSIAQRPTGVLLYGPPGCGKTMMAKAIAAEGQAAFISVSPSSLEHKYVGETPKAVGALFGLARKLAPTVIFIDEVDGLLGARAEGEQSWSLGLKSSLLQHWDGLTASVKPQRQQHERSAKGSKSSAPPAWVVVLGATNRPWALDEAALRRMPRQIRIDLPDASGRADILRRLLAKERCDPSCASQLGRVAAVTAGFSGSDLAEVVREAVQIPISEALHAKLSQQLDGEAKAHDGEVAGYRPYSSSSSSGSSSATVSEDGLAVDIDTEDAAGDNNDGGSAAGDDNEAGVSAPMSSSSARQRQQHSHVRTTTIDDVLLAAAMVRPSGAIAHGHNYHYDSSHTTTGATGAPSQSDFLAWAARAMGAAMQGAAAGRDFSAMG